MSLICGVVVRCLLLAPVRQLLALTFARPSHVTISTIHVLILSFGLGLLPLMLQGGVLCVKDCYYLRGECLDPDGLLLLFRTLILVVMNSSSIRLPLLQNDHNLKMVAIGFTKSIRSRASLLITLDISIKI